MAEGEPGEIVENGVIIIFGNFILIKWNNYYFFNYYNYNNYSDDNFTKV